MKSDTLWLLAAGAAAYWIYTQSQATAAKAAAALAAQTAAANAPTSN